jgi:hypothetical protein
MGGVPYDPAPAASLTLAAVPSLDELAKDALERAKANLISLGNGGSFMRPIRRADRLFFLSRWSFDCPFGNRNLRQSVDPGPGWITVFDAVAFVDVERTY